MLEKAINIILKKYAKIIGSKACRKGILDKTTNSPSGFRAAGLWPLYLPAMQLSLKFF